jgi:hypothetical protein
MGKFRISADGADEFVHGKHRFEHWDRDNTAYFITARCREGYPAFALEEAKLVFWDRFDHYTKLFGYVPWITTLLDNHYHNVGYMKHGENLGPMMQRIHGSVAKLVNDILVVRRVPFWRDAGHHDYFDGCLRNTTQLRRAYRYTLLQARRAGICAHHRTYAHTRVGASLDEAVALATDLRAFMDDVRYQRYDGR